MTKQGGGALVDSSALDCVPLIGEHVGPSSFWSVAVFGTITYWAQPICSIMVGPVPCSEQLDWKVHQYVANCARRAGSLET